VGFRILATDQAFAIEFCSAAELFDDQGNKQGSGPHIAWVSLRSPKYLLFNKYIDKKFDAEKKYTLYRCRFVA
jgi:hypothetical protein